MLTVDNFIFFTAYGLVAFGAYLVVKHLAEGKKDK